MDRARNKDKGLAGMRQLTEHELTQVSGAGDIADAAIIGAAIGGAICIGYASAARTTGKVALAMAVVGAACMSGLFASGQAAWEAGRWLNTNTHVQPWVARAIDSLT
jgi:hypothetical protein